MQQALVETLAKTDPVLGATAAMTDAAKIAPASTQAVRNASTPARLVENPRGLEAAARVDEPVRTARAAGSGGVNSAEAAADIALAAGKKTGAAAELRVGNHVFTGVSGEMVPHNSQVTGALMGTPHSARAPWHGGCAEVVCLDKALNAGVNPAGGSARAVNIGVSGSGHNTLKPTCASCGDLFRFFGVSE